MKFIQRTVPAGWLPIGSCEELSPRINIHFPAGYFIPKLLLLLLLNYFETVLLNIVVIAT